MATFSSAGLTIQFSFESRPRRRQQWSQHNSDAWDLEIRVRYIRRVCRFAAERALIGIEKGML